jgi:molybdenum cofactor synthesis domain-containing protein
LLASVGKSQVLVSRRPRVAILATGDELVEVSENPNPDQIRNSNTYTLHAQVVGAGAEPVLLGIGRDNVEDLRVKIREGLKHDILLVSGGVSMGKYDFVEDVFAEFGSDGSVRQCGDEAGEADRVWFCARRLSFSDCREIPCPRLLPFTCLCDLSSRPCLEQHRPNGFVYARAWKKRQVRSGSSGDRTRPGSFRWGVLSNSNRALEGLVRPRRAFSSECDGGSS